MPSDGSPILKPGTIINNQFVISRPLGKGAFGSIFEASFIERPDFGPVAIKIENDNSVKKVLKLEISVLKKLHGRSFYPLIFFQGKKLFPRIFTEGFYNGNRYCVMEMLGYNLSDLLRRRPARRFSIQTVLNLAYKMLTCIQALHSINWIHRDIKPSNFVIGQEGKHVHRIYLIDFGLVKRTHSEDGIEYPERPNVGFRGTARYASVNAHKSRDLGRVDDLWSLLYCLVEFHKGSLPWTRLKDKSAIGRMKEEIVKQKLLEGMPTVFHDFYDYLTTLGFHDVPDYACLLNQFKHFLIASSPRIPTTPSLYSVNGAMSIPASVDFFDWEREPYPLSASTPSPSSQRNRRPPGLPLPGDDAKTSDLSQTLRTQAQTLRSATPYTLSPSTSIIPTHSALHQTSTRQEVPSIDSHKQPDEMDFGKIIVSPRSTTPTSAKTTPRDTDSRTDVEVSNASKTATPTSQTGFSQTPPIHHPAALNSMQNLESHSTSNVVASSALTVGSDDDRRETSPDEHHFSIALVPYSAQPSHLSHSETTQTLPARFRARREDEKRWSRKGRMKRVVLLPVQLMHQTSPHLHIPRLGSSQTLNDWMLFESQRRDLLLYSLHSEKEDTLLHASLPSLAQLVNSWHNHSPMLTPRTPETYDTLLDMTILSEPMTLTVYTTRTVGEREIEGLDSLELETNSTCSVDLRKARETMRENHVLIVSAGVAEDLLSRAPSAPQLGPPSTRCQPVENLTARSRLSHQLSSTPILPPRPASSTPSTHPSPHEPVAIDKHTEIVADMTSASMLDNAPSVSTITSLPRLAECNDLLEYSVLSILHENSILRSLSRAAVQLRMSILQKPPKVKRSAPNSTPISFAMSTSSGSHPTLSTLSDLEYTHTSHTKILHRLGLHPLDSIDAVASPSPSVTRTSSFTTSTHSLPHTQSSNSSTFFSFFTNYSPILVHLNPPVSPILLDYHSMLSRVNPNFGFLPSPSSVIEAASDPIQPSFNNCDFHPSMSPSMYFHSDYLPSLSLNDGQTTLLTGHSSVSSFTRHRATSGRLSSTAHSISQMSASLPILPKDTPEEHRPVSEHNPPHNKSPVQKMFDIKPADLLQNEALLRSLIHQQKHAQFPSDAILVARHNCGPAVRHATLQPVHTNRFEGVWDAAPSFARFVSARDLGIVQSVQFHSSKDASRHPQRDERGGRCFATADHSLTAVKELQHATVTDRSPISVDVVQLAESPANVELLATSCFSTPPTASHLPLPFSPALLRLPLSTLLTLPFSDQIAVLRHLNPTQDRTAISATTSPSSEQKRDFTSPSSASSGTDINRWLSSRSPKSASTASSRLESVEERNEEPKTADERFRLSDELRQVSALPTSMHSVQLPNQTTQPSSPSDAFIRMSQMSSPLSMSRRHLGHQQKTVHPLSIQHTTSSLSGDTFDNGTIPVASPSLSLTEQSTACTVHDTRSPATEREDESAKENETDSGRLFVLSSSDITAVTDRLFTPPSFLTTTPHSTALTSFPPRQSLLFSNHDSLLHIFKSSTDQAMNAQEQNENNSVLSAAQTKTKLSHKSSSFHTPQSKVEKAGRRRSGTESTLHVLSDSPSSIEQTAATTSSSSKEAGESDTTNNTRSSSVSASSRQRANTHTTSLQIQTEMTTHDLDSPFTPHPHTPSGGSVSPSRSNPQTSHSHIMSLATLLPNATPRSTHLSSTNLSGEGRKKLIVLTVSEDGNIDVLHTMSMNGLSSSSAASAVQNLLNEDGLMPILNWTALVKYRRRSDFRYAQI
ncbi:putative Tau-tubulin kinase 1 [Blattamonas nauphoetae]|uniref:Tau-tubulin kinase 1 n=1 Tax=Blattamonas nauphoetae TaxID=2049346 RepID=A0ABQ9XPF3_9EUKA|nr:putative Tau-tubulin kinase 1 [Blattamonas nauphoetae]